MLNPALGCPPRRSYAHQLHDSPSTFPSLTEDPHTQGLVGTHSHSEQHISPPCGLWSWPWDPQELGPRFTYSSCHTLRAGAADQPSAGHRVRPMGEVDAGRPAENTPSPGSRAPDNQDSTAAPHRSAVPAPLPPSGSTFAAPAMPSLGPVLRALSGVLIHFRCLHAWPRAHSGYACVQLLAGVPSLGCQGRSALPCAPVCMKVP